MSTFLRRRCQKEKVGKCVNKKPPSQKKGVSGGEGEKWQHGGRGGVCVFFFFFFFFSSFPSSPPPDPKPCIVRLAALRSARVSCRCVWLIGAEVRKQGCGHLLIIGWKLL